MKINILIILLLNLIFLNSIVNSQQTRNYYVQNNGTDSNYCGQSTSQSCLTPVGAINSFKYSYGYYSSISFQLVINFGKGYQWYGGNSYTSANLNNLNVSFVGSPDGSTYFFNSFSNLPLFNVTGGSEFSAITFTNISYGMPSFTCNHNYQYPSLIASLLLIQPNNYYSVDTYVQFNNFVLSCRVFDIPIIATDGYNNLGSASNDYNDYFYGSLSSYQPNIFITFNSISFNQSTTYSFNSQLISAPNIPTSVSIVNSFIELASAQFNTLSPLINVGRGNLMIDNSKIQISSYYPTGDFYFLGASSTQVDITNSNITLSGTMGNFLTCQGCFFKADNINITTLCTGNSQMPFNFIYASASFYNSFMASVQDGGLISTSDSQLALRSNIIISSFANSVTLDKTNAFIFANTLSSYYDGNGVYYYSTYTPIYCTSDSQSNIVGDYSVQGYGYTSNCSKYTKDFKLKWYFGFLSVGIVGTLFIYIFLASTIAIIKRCGGGDS
ncbi:hypothetical protein ACTA71_002294 [Dictyostelium dimigraforme]